MKRFIYSSMLLMGICVLVACTGKAVAIPLAALFTEEGVRFELKADSTTLIQFNDSLTYEGTWQVCKSADNLEYATIEFAGYPAYYFLKDGKLYRSEREMRNDVLGRRINYPNDIS